MGRVQGTKGEGQGGGDREIGSVKISPIQGPKNLNECGHYMRELKLRLTTLTRMKRKKGNQGRREGGGAKGVKQRKKLHCVCTKSPS